MELQNKIREFDQRGVAVVAVAQGASDLDSALAVLEALGGEPPFELLVDLGREQSAALDWMTTYVVDAGGTVREILPVHRGMGLTWDTVLQRLDELELGTSR